MANVTGWDTNGVTNLGALRNGRLKLEFTGLDGAKRNIFIPRTSIPALVASLIGFSAKVAAADGEEDILVGKHLLGVKNVTVASDDAGTEYVLALTTGDGLQLRLHLDANTTEALALGLIATLQKHGRFHLPCRPEDLGR